MVKPNLKKKSFENQDGQGTEQSELDKKQRKNTKMTDKAKDKYLQAKIQELNSLDSKLSTLKKGVAAFCLFIIILNVYHIKRLGTVSTDLSGLMNKYNETVERIDNIKQRHKSSYINFLDRNRNFMRLRPDIKDPSPEVEQFMDDPLHSMEKGEIERHRRILDERLSKSTEDITAYIMPFEIMIGDYDGPFFEQSTLFS